LQEQEKWDAMGEASHEYVQQHGIQNTIKNLEEHYAHVAAKTPSSASNPQQHGGS